MLKRERRVLGKQAGLAKVLTVQFLQQRQIFCCVAAASSSQLAIAGLKLLNLKVWPVATDV